MMRWRRAAVVLSGHGTDVPRAVSSGIGSRRRVTSLTPAASRSWTNP